MSGTELWVVGMLVCIFGCFLASVGLALQKVTHTRREKAKIKDSASLRDSLDPSVEDKPYYTEPVWVAGMMFIVVDAILDVLSYGLAPQSLLAPLASLTMVFNAIVAPRFLGEPISKDDYYGTFIIVAGVTLTITGSEKETPTYDMAAIRALYARTIVPIYLITIGVVLLSLYLWAKQLGPEGETAEHLAQIRSPMKRKLLAASYPIQGGIWGGISVQFMKCVVELTKTTMEGDSQLGYFEFWMFTGFLAVSLILQAHFLNCGLQRFDALFIIPLYQVIWIISGVLGGGIVFNEFAVMTFGDVLLFGIGAAVIFFGVFFIAKRKTDGTKISTEALLDDIGDETDYIRMGNPSDSEDSGADSTAINMITDTPDNMFDPERLPDESRNIPDDLMSVGVASLMGENEAYLAASQHDSEEVDEVVAI